MSIFRSNDKVLFFKWDFATVGNRNRHSPIVNLKSNTFCLMVQGEGKVANAAVGVDAESISSSPNQKFECPCK